MDSGERKELPLDRSKVVLFCERFMEKSEIKEAVTKVKRSNRWRWSLGALIVVFLAVAVSSKIGFFSKDHNSFSYSHHQDLGIDKGVQKLKLPMRLWRERPPTTYSVKFESFATMKELVKDGYYESRPFTVDGFNWTFLIYPNGNKKETLGAYVSLYVRIDNSSLIIDPQDVYAEIKFFVYNVNGIHHMHYYTYQETEAMKFHLYKPKWGVPEFLPAVWFDVPAYGYILDGGQCVFGIDVFVAQPFNKWEVFSYDENISNPIFTWNLTNFSTLNLDSYTSDLFTSGGRNWLLKVYPNGDGSYLSLYLLSETNEKDYVRAKLRVLNQFTSNHVEKPVKGWPNAAENGWGFEKFIALADLQDGSKGYVVDDLLQVEVEITAFSNTDTF